MSTALRATSRNSTEVSTRAVGAWLLPSLPCEDLAKYARSHLRADETSGELSGNMLSTATSLVEVAPACARELRCSHRYVNAQSQAATPPLRLALQGLLVHQTAIARPPPFRRCHNLEVLMAKRGAPPATQAVALLPERLFSALNIHLSRSTAPFNASSHKMSAVIDLSSSAATVVQGEDGASIS